ncbi:MAG: LamG domain-containing protein [Calditrichaeota bacterium]|nr:LamG domain-containing protein [Calditrichota bacterium]MCB9366937.1 LamG domain-containing protein [Calditrichota bacterium]
MRLALMLLLLSFSFPALSGETNYCFDFDGKESGAKLEQLDGLRSLNGTRSYTFEAWVRPRTQGGGGRGRILDQERSGLTFYLSDDARVGFRPSKDSGWQLSDKGVISFWTWQHVAVSSDGKLLRFFVNGKLITATPFDAALSITSKPVWIGNGVGEDDQPRGFDGWIDDIRVSAACLWTKDFSPPERGIFRPSVSSTVLDVTFDEGPAYKLALDYSTYNAEVLSDEDVRRASAK